MLRPPTNTSRGFYYGWVMLPVAAVVAVCSTPGQTVGVSAFNPALRAAAGVSETTLGLSYLVATLAASTLFTWLGVGIDRHGPRRLLAIVALGLAGGCVALASTTNLVVLTLGFFLVRVFGQGGMSLVSSHTLANWFDRRLGLAMGISAVGFSLGIAYAQALCNDLIALVGWRWAQVTLGAGVCLVILPLAGLVYRNYPADVGQRVEGGDATDTPPEPRAGATLREALRSPAWWGLAAIGGFWAAAGTAVIFFSKAITASAGFGPEAAEGVLLAFGLALSVLTLPMGYLADRLPLRTGFGLGVALAGAGLYLLAGARGAWWLYASGATMGAAQATLMGFNGVAVPRLFGRLHMGRIKGSLGSVMSASSALGPAAFAALRDGSGGFGPPLTVAAACTLPLLLAAWPVGSAHRLSTAPPTR